MGTERRRSRCRERLERFSDSTLDATSFRLEAIAELRRTIGFDRWCWPLADPETLIPLSGLAEHDYGPQVGRSLALEYSGGDFAAMHVVARQPEPVASLSAETHGDLARSPRWDQVLRPVGIGDEAVVACRDPLGCWGWIKAYRDHDDAPFAPEDLALLADLGPGLGSALRRRVDRANRSGAAVPGPPGVVVLDDDLRPVSWTAGARSWIDALPLAELFALWDILPAVVYPVAALARADGSTSAHALEHAADGRCVQIEAARLEGDDGGRIAVTLRSATPAERFDLMCRGYALTRRERQVVSALVAGLDTRALAERLYISRHTVQDHLKSVFTKVGVRSRRELVAAFGDAPDDL